MKIINNELVKRLVGVGRVACTRPNGQRGARTRELTTFPSSRFLNSFCVVKINVSSSSSLGTPIYCRISVKGSEFRDRYLAVTNVKFGTQPVRVVIESCIEILTTSSHFQELSSQKSISDSGYRPLSYTGWLVRMSHRKWRENKLQLMWWPEVALLGCC